MGWAKYNSSIWQIHLHWTQFTAELLYSSHLISNIWVRPAVPRLLVSTTDAAGWQNQTYNVGGLNSRCHLFLKPSSISCMNASFLCSKSGRDFHNYSSNLGSFQSISDQCLKALVGVLIACSIILMGWFICCLVTCTELWDGKILMISEFRQKYVLMLCFVRNKVILHCIWGYTFFSLYRFFEYEYK